MVDLQRGVNVAPDDGFGPETRADLVAFQRQQRISPTDVADHLVWE